MKIRIRYGFYTDGDFSLRDPEIFGCSHRETEIEDEYFDYFGGIDFENQFDNQEEIWRCKFSAKSFLEKILCNGIHISYTHYWLMKDFYDIIETLLKFIDNNNCGELCKRLSGNYDGTFIRVEFI